MKSGAPIWDRTHHGKWPTRAHMRLTAHLFYEALLSGKYSTRSVEHVLTWVLIAWSWSVMTDDVTLSGPLYAPMIQMMPERAWGGVGLAIGVIRWAALIGNGHWRPSPILRTICAAWGMLFMMSLAYCYWLAISAGVPDFPMRRALYVLILAEAYSILRGSQDIKGQEARFRALASDRAGRPQYVSP